jgi:hypothetical protein
MPSRAFNYSLGTLLGVVTLVGVAMGLIVSALPVGIIFVGLAITAWQRTAEIAALRRAAQRPLGTGEMAWAFLSSLLRISCVLAGACFVFVAFLIAAIVLANVPDGSPFHGPLMLAAAIVPLAGVLAAVVTGNRIARAIWYLRASDSGNGFSVDQNGDSFAHIVEE